MASDPFGLTQSGISPELQAEYRGLTRQQAIEQAMLEQSMKPAGGLIDAGRYKVAPSPLEGIGRLLQGHFARQNLSGLDDKFADIGKRHRDAQAAEVSRYMSMKNGTPEVPAVTDVAQTNQSMDTFDTKPAMPAVAGDTKGAIASALMTQNPNLQWMRNADMAQMNALDKQKAEYALKAAEAEKARSFKADESALTREQRMELADKRIAAAGTPEQKMDAMLQKIQLQQQFLLGASKVVTAPDGSKQVMTEAQLRGMANGGQPQQQQFPPSALDNLPPNVANAIRADMRKTGVQSANIQMGPTDAAAGTNVNPANIVTGQVNLDGAPASVAPALPGAGLGAKPADPRYDPDKQRAIEEAKAAGKATGQNSVLKPIPAAALKMQQEDLEALGTAKSIVADLDQFTKQIESGKLPLGLITNPAAGVQNWLGRSTEETRNLATFKANLVKLQNDSLRLNKGVQTEGDAIRSWNELITNINDPKVVMQRLNEIKALNERAANLRKMNVDTIRKNYGHPPMDTSAYEAQPAAVNLSASSRPSSIDDRLKRY